VADARAQYAIDIAARLMGGDATIAQLDTLTTSLMGGGKEADFFSAALGTIESEMKSAQLATESANAALKIGTEQYSALETAAVQAAKAAERAALKNGGLIPPELFAEQERAKAAVDAHAVALKGLEGAAKHAKLEEDRLAGVQRNLVKVQAHVAKSLASTAEQSGKLKEAIGAVGGPLGGLAQRAFGPVDSFNKLSQAFGASQAAGILMGLGVVAVAAAVVALTVATAAGVVAVSAWGVKLADTARNAALSNEAFQAAHPALDGYSAAADRAASASGLAGEALRGLAVKLEAARVSADDMPAALEAAAISERALGSGGADRFVESIRAGTKSVSELAAVAKASFGGIVAKQLLSLDAQIARFKVNIGQTFGGIKIDPLLEGVRTLGRLFDADTASGRALKSLFDGFVQPLVDGFTEAIPAIEAFFLGIEIGLLKLGIFLKPTTKAIKEALGFSDSSTESTLAALATAGQVAAVVVAGLVASVGVLAAVVVPAAALALVGLASVVVSLGAGIAAIGAVVAGAGYALTKFFEKLWSDTLGAVQVGKDLALGLANGIADGAGAIVNALTSAVSGAITAAKKLLGIASPSKVFAEIGGNTVLGYAAGIDAAAPLAHEAVADALAPPQKRSLASLDMSAERAGSGAPVQSTSTTTDNSRSVNLGSSVFNFYGVKDAEDSESRLRDVVFQIFSGELAQSGWGA